VSGADAPELVALDVLLATPGVTAAPDRLRAEARSYVERRQAITGNADTTPEAKQRGLNAEREKFETTLTALREADRAHLMKALDAEEGEIRRAALPPSKPSSYLTDNDVRLQMMQALDLAARRAEVESRIRALGACEDLELLTAGVEDVALMGSQGQAAEALQVVEGRLRAIWLATAEHERGPITAALLRAQDAVKQHHAANPGPTARLKDVARRRALVDQQLDRFYGGYLAALLKTTPSAAQARQMQVEASIAASGR